MHPTHPVLCCVFSAVSQDLSTCSVISQLFIIISFFVVSWIDLNYSIDVRYELFAVNSWILVSQSQSLYLVHLSYFATKLFSTGNCLYSTTALWWRIAVASIDIAVALDLVGYWWLIDLTSVYCYCINTLQILSLEVTAVIVVYCDGLSVCLSVCVYCSKCSCCYIETDFQHFNLCTKV
jgi:hypothetical protein